MRDTVSMTYAYEKYRGPCSGHAQPGTLRVQAALLAYVPGTRDGGVYNCRDVAGSSSPSIHGEGRAGDVMCPSESGETSQGLMVVDALLRLAPVLQIQCIIHGRRIWTVDRPTWRAYSGSNPHWNHVHWEQTREAAVSLTQAQVDAAFASLAAPVPPPRPIPKPSRTPPAVLATVFSLIAQAQKQVLRQGSTGFYVAQLQRMLLGLGFYHGAIDGDFGPHTRDAVIAYQTHVGFRGRDVDGIVGPQTWAAIFAGRK